MAKNTDPIRAVTKVPNIGLRGRELVREFRRKMREAHLEAREEGKRILSDAILASGFLRPIRLVKSVSAVFVKDDNEKGFTTAIGFKKPGSEYAFFANYGSDPHRTFASSGGKTMRQNLLSWARAKGVDERAVWHIQKRIREEGTEGGHFIERATPKIEKAFERVARKKVREFTGSRNRK